MNKIKHYLTLFYNLILSNILVIIGFSGCDIEAPVEYGTPNADFKVNGKVESMVNKLAIPNIQVTMHYDSVKTDLSGNYVIKANSFPTSQSFQIQFKDIDGDENGAYQDLDTLIEFNDPSFTNGDGHWYEGETSQEFYIMLTPKK